MLPPVTFDSSLTPAATGEESSNVSVSPGQSSRTSSPTRDLDRASCALATDGEREPVVVERHLQRRASELHPERQMSTAAGSRG